MNDGLVSSAQADALIREIAQQFRAETSAVAKAGEVEAQAVVARSRAIARSRMHEAILDLRRDGARRIASAKARIDSEARALAQRASAQAVDQAMTLLDRVLTARWRNEEARAQWAESLAKQCGSRLRPGEWVIEYPEGWSEAERRAFEAALGSAAEVTFNASGDITAGLRISADDAVLDATPHGLLADRRTVTAMLLAGIEHG